MSITAAAARWQQRWQRQVYLLLMFQHCLLLLVTWSHPGSCMRTGMAGCAPPHQTLAAAASVRCCRGIFPGAQQPPPGTLHRRILLLPSAGAFSWDRTVTQQQQLPLQQCIAFLQPLVAHSTCQRFQASTKQGNYQHRSSSSMLGVNAYVHLASRSRALCHHPISCTLHILFRCNRWLPRTLFCNIFYNTCSPSAA